MKWFEITRAREWDYSKAGICLLPVLWQQAIDPDGMRWFQWIGALAFLVGFFATAYMVNDLSDRECDRRAGKHRAIHALTPQQGVAWVALHLALSLGGLAVIGARDLGILVAGAGLSYLALFTYSLPPVRWKERGVAGLVVAAAAQRVFPMLALSSMAPHLRIEVVLFMTAALLQGVRWILIHQVMDLAADRVGGVETWTTRRGSPLARRLLVAAVLPAEMMAGIGAALLAMRTLPMLGPALAIYALGAMLFHAIRMRRGQALDWCSYSHAPGADLLFIVLPMALLFSVPSARGSWIAALLVLAATSGMHLTARLVELGHAFARPRTAR
jgi:4-hydroxybenzoate polyprenyltransferase